MKAILDSGLEFDENLIQGNNFSKSRYGYLAMEKFLNMNPRPTAIFAANDILVLVGYADLVESRRMDVPLTTVRQPGYEMGKTACERLIGKIKNPKDSKTKKIVFKTELIIRKSCGNGTVQRRGLM